MTYPELIEKLDKLPKIDSAYVYDGEDYALRDGEKIEAKLIKFTADDIDSAQIKMVHEVMSLIRGKREVWVRIMPEITLRTYEPTGETYVTAYARIAVA